MSMSVLGCMTIGWMTEQEIEERANRPVANALEYLLARGLIWKRIDASEDRWEVQYCRAHELRDVLIGKSHVGRLAAPPIVPRAKPVTFGDAIRMAAK